MPDTMFSKSCKPECPHCGAELKSDGPGYVCDTYPAIHSHPYICSACDRKWTRSYKLKVKGFAGEYDTLTLR